MKIVIKNPTVPKQRITIKDVPIGIPFVYCNYINIEEASTLDRNCVCIKLNDNGSHNILCLSEGTVSKLSADESFYFFPVKFVEMEIENAPMVAAK